MARRTPSTSNPAQRLFDILQRHSEVAAAEPAIGYVATWARVFEVDAGSVAEHVAESFGLVGEIDRALAAGQVPGSGVAERAPS